MGHPFLKKQLNNNMTMCQLRFCQKINPENRKK